MNVRMVMPAAPARNSGWLLLTFVSVFIAWGSFVYVTGDPRLYDGVFRAKYIAHLGVVWSHGVAATLALAIGPWQFWTGLRRKFPSLHRTTGLLYMGCMAVGAVSGVAMGLDAHGGVASRIGFTSMAVLWLVTACLGWRAVLQRNIRAHREWMMRNFALTFGAVLLRLYLYGLQHLGFNFNVIYPYVTWAAWLPNIIAVELWLWSFGPFRTSAAAGN